MPSFREIKRRISGVANIQQITRAMKMVAGARLRRSETGILALRPFSSRLDGLVARLLADAAGTEHPFFQEREVGKRALLVLSSDRGLCGSYNNRIVAGAMRLMDEGGDVPTEIYSIGKRGTDRFKALGMQVTREWEDVFNPVQFTTVKEVGGELCERFMHQELDEVIIVFAEFFSPLTQQVTHRRLLPSTPEMLRDQVRQEGETKRPEGVSNEAETLERAESHVYNHEPGFDAILDKLLEYNLDLQIYRAMLEAQASEHGARMMAMDNATENADEMIEELTLTMNRLRQETITTEIIDVVGGAEALG
jgi:F-type H+-transporting ATPase subunit gamma